MTKSIRLSDENLHNLANQNTGIPEEMRELAKQYVDIDNENAEFLRGVSSALTFVRVVFKTTTHESFMADAIVQECAKKILQKDGKSATEGLNNG